MGLMSEAHKHNLNRNRVRLMKNVQSLPSICEFLRQDYTLTDEMQSEIQGMKTHDRQVSKLIDVLSRRSDVAFERFVRALVHTHQDDLAILLDPNTAHNLIETRNRQLQSNAQVPRSDPLQQMHVVNPAGNLAHVLPVMFVQPASGLSALPITSVPVQLAGMQTVMPLQQGAVYANTSQISVPDFRKEIVNSVDGSALMNVNVILQPTANVDYLKNTQRIYSMERRPRGRALIISNRYFLKAELESRDGAEFDEINIRNLFAQLHFEVQLYTNKSASEMKTILENERGLDCHRNASAFVLVLLTHGSQGSVYGIDGEKVLIDDITTFFDGRNCPQLQNKPKLFFIQACQGRKKSSRFQTDGPTNVQPSDARPSSQSASEARPTDENLGQKLALLSLEDDAGYVPPLPPASSQAHEKADMLIAYATVKGYEAWRHAELGSWFVRTLVYVFQRQAHYRHILDMLTEVNYLVSQLETEGTQVPYRQVAQKTDTLLKQLYFLPGYPAV